MSILSNQIARMMDAREAGAARFGAEAAMDHALAIERVWERRAAALVVRGTAESGAQHLAAAAACCWKRGREVGVISCELPESELEWQAMRLRGQFGPETRWRGDTRDLLIDGLGCELYDPAPVAAFLAARFAADATPRAFVATFIWTPLTWEGLGARYGGDATWRLRQAAAEICIP